MLKKFRVMFAMIAVLALFSSCSVRLVDFTVISSKNVNLDIDRSSGVQTEGKKSYFLNIGFNLKDAMDNALENAGKEYDMLVDGVVTYSSYPFVSVVKVEGLAVNTSEMKNRMGSVEFNKWLNNQQVSYDKNTQVVSSEIKIVKED